MDDEREICKKNWKTNLILKERERTNEWMNEWMNEWETSWIIQNK
jgi:hypothetical protein